VKIAEASGIEALVASMKAYKTTEELRIKRREKFKDCRGRWH
jgi:hypothetical protein